MSAEWVSGFDDSFSWLDSNEWQRHLTCDKDSLVTDSTLINSKLAVRLLLRDGIDFHEDLFIRQCTVQNLADHTLPTDKKYTAALP